MATKNELDDRVKVLFVDLKDCLEPATVQPRWTVRPVRPGVVADAALGADEPSQINDRALIQRKTYPICPYLRSDWDYATRYGYPHTHNVCYRAKKSRAVHLTYQAEVCIKHQFQRCPVYLAAQPKGRVLAFLSSLFSGWSPS